MSSRRNVLIASGSLGISSLAGCLDALQGNPSVREVNVIFRNWRNSTNEFRFALETDKKLLEWRSRTLDPESHEVGTIDVPTDSNLVAFHGTVNGRERILEFDNLDTSKDKVCLYLYFEYGNNHGDAMILRRAPINDC